MKKTFLTIAMFSCVMLLQSQDVEKKVREKDPTTVINEAMLALNLVNFGYSNQDPVALFAAIQIISNNPFQKLSPEKSESENEVTVLKENETPELNVNQLLTDAKLFADGNDKVIALIEDFEKTNDAQTVVSRGRRDGPAYVTRRVNANSSYTDYIIFRGGEIAEIAISGDGDTDLDLYVYDENGNLVGSDTDYTDDCYVSFRPRWTGSFKVVVKNLGNVYNRYILMTN